MIRFVSTEITFREVPNEVCRSFSISNCGLHCPNCHSPELQQDYGRELDENLFTQFLYRDEDTVSCYVFLGEGNDSKKLKRLLTLCKRKNYKTCVYTGHKGIDVGNTYFGLIDYIKVGAYIEELGGLESPTTNQRFYKLTYSYDTNTVGYTDLTYKFQKNVKTSKK